MDLPDVNVLVYAHRADAPDHEVYARWVTQMATRDAAFGLADLVLSGFLRIVTHPRIFAQPTPLPVALAFVDELRDRPNCVGVAPGSRHWSLFTSLCQRVQAKGNAVPDAYLAALALEHGAAWVTTDRGFARFPGLHWRHPLGT
jgi:toxin-antitoxin system PIN domain toxin